MKASRSQAIAVAKKLNINLETYFAITPAMWTFAINVELEHASLLSEFGVKNKEEYFLFAGKIAIAHLLEYPDYYTRLKEMEKIAKKFWKNKIQPKIFK
jgi:hypothetical protein